jgi:hypothetical protein
MRPMDYVLLGLLAILLSACGQGSASSAETGASPRLSSSRLSDMGLAPGHMAGETFAPGECPFGIGCWEVGHAGDECRCFVSKAQHDAYWQDGGAP